MGLPVISVTESELIEALRQASAAAPDPDGAVVTQDIVRAMGKGERFVRTILRDLIAQGVVEMVKVRRPAIDGRVIPQPAYRVKARAA